MNRRAITASAGELGKAAQVKPLEIAGCTLEALKWMALILMTVDHVNKYLLHDSMPALFQAGRISMPLFVFVLAYNAARPDFFTSGAATRTCLRLTGYGLAACVPYMALGTVREARFFGVRLVKEIKRLVLLRIEHARKCHPAQEQGHRHTESEDQGITPAPHSSTLQSVLQKKC